VISKFEQYATTMALWKLEYWPGKPQARLTRRGMLSATAALLMTSNPRQASASSDCLSAATVESGLPIAMIRPSRPLPAVKLFRLEGGVLNLDSLRGKPALVNFWATWCAPCRTELPVLDRLLRSRQMPDLSIVAVSHDKGSRSTVERYKKSIDLRKLPIFLDPHEFVGYANRDNPNKAPFAIYGMPITYLVSRSGFVVGYGSGSVDWLSRPALRILACLDDI
jgi:thiol-disulfide isomerase/thioredoxin